MHQSQGVLIPLEDETLQFKYLKPWWSRNSTQLQSKFQTDIRCFEHLNTAGFTELMNRWNFLIINASSSVHPTLSTDVLSTPPHSSPFSTMKNVSLDLQQKRMIVAEAERRRLEYEDASGQKLSLWEKFHLHFAPNLTTITRLLRPLAPPRTGSSHGRIDKKIRCRDRHCNMLDFSLYQWICDMFNKIVDFSHSLLRKKAKRLQDLENSQVEENSKVNLKPLDFKLQAPLTSAHFQVSCRRRWFWWDCRCGVVSFSSRKVYVLR